MSLFLVTKGRPWLEACRGVPYCTLLKHAFVGGAVDGRARFSCLEALRRFFACAQQQCIRWRRHSSQPASEMSAAIIAAEPNSSTIGLWLGLALWQTLLYGINTVLIPRSLVSNVGRFHLCDSLIVF